jgi:hypothetical protein
MTRYYKGNRNGCRSTWTSCVGGGPERGERRNYLFRGWLGPESINAADDYSQPCLRKGFTIIGLTSATSSD